MANKTSNLLKYLGMVGNTGLRTGALVPRANTPDAEQRIQTEFEKAGEVANPELWTKFNSYMKRPTTFDSMLQLWEEMAGWDLLAAALIEIVDEATQVDSNSPATVWYQCNDRDFEEELNDMLLRLRVEEIIQSQVYYVSSLGNHFEKIEYAPGKEQGVMGLSFVHPVEMRRYWLERNRKCIGYRWIGHKPDKEDVFVHPDNRTPVERVAMTNGKDIEDLWYPWDFMHFRRMFRQRATEHGEPIFAEADGIYKKLRLAIDQMVVHRAQVQPDRYAINIDVQEQPPIEQMKTVQRWRQQLRSKISFGQAQDPNALSSPSDFSSYYNALALDTIIYLAQPKGFNNTITKLQGTAQIPDVYDIELLTDLFYSIIGMPRSWFGGGGQGGGDSGEAPSGKALLAQDMRFLRKIKSIRRPIIQQYEWLAYFHAVLTGKNPEQLDIKAMMPPIGSLEDQMKMELLERQAQVLDILADVMEKYKLPKEAWIEVVFKRYMHLPDDVVNVFITALPGEIEQTQEESLKRPRKPAPMTHKLIREIDERMSKTPEAVAALRQLSESLEYGVRVGNPRRVFKPTTKSILDIQEAKTNDVVIASLGAHPLQFVSGGEKSIGRMLQERVDHVAATEQPSVAAPQPEPQAVDESMATRPLPSQWRKWIG